MISVYSVLFTLVLFSELSSNLVTVAIPSSKAENGITQQDGLGSLLGDEPLTEEDMVPRMYRRSLVLDDDVRDENGNPKIFVVSVSDSLEQL